MSNNAVASLPASSMATWLSKMQRGSLSRVKPISVFVFYRPKMSANVLGAHCHPEEEEGKEADEGGGGENIVWNRITVSAGGARGNTNRAHTRLGSMCILQAGNNQAHWGVKKDLCNGCSVCLQRTKCRAGTIVNQVHVEEMRRDLFIYLGCV